MPRLKCNFCESLVFVKPSNLKIEGFVPRCYKCSTSHPPPDWQCQGSTNSTRKRQDRKKGDRCCRWRMVQHKYCYSHISQEEE